MSTPNPFANGSAGSLTQVANAIQAQSLQNQFTQAVFNGWLAGIDSLKQTAAELTLGVTPVDYSYPPGHIYRYAANVQPGVTDMTVAINTAANVCRQGNYVLQLPPDTCLVSAPLNFSNIRVVGAGAAISSGAAIPHIQATSAQFNVITSTGNTVFEDLVIHGGWDGVTAGLSGDTIELIGGSGACFNIRWINTQILFSKKRGVYWEGAGYSYGEHLEIVQAGLHGLEIFGVDIAHLCTTVHFHGNSRFSGTPNGYGVKLTECVAMHFDSVIMEQTKGIQLNGADNRSITFNEVYQENTAGGLFLDGTGSAGIGLSITNCFGGTAAVANLTGWTDVFFGHSNASLTLPPVPLANSIIQNDGGAFTTSTTGGVDVTAAQVTLGPGVWFIWWTLQTLQSTASGLTQAAGQLTTSAGASGLNNNTGAGTFEQSADEQTYNPGTSMDLRLKGFTLVSLTAASTTIFLRSHLVFSGAGALSYHGFINAMLFK